mmetsp:Transcript_14856/g.42834  ORF Transcript_14856/g.42834 Transcript_14856/m.42834 type:complete len:256 (+) Transcript_14856:157-924(+)
MIPGRRSSARLRSSIIRFPTCMPSSWLYNTSATRTKSTSSPSTGRGSGPNRSSTLDSTTPSSPASCTPYSNKRRLRALMSVAITLRAPSRAAAWASNPVPAPSTRTVLPTMSSRLRACISPAARIDPGHITTPNGSPIFSLSASPEDHQSSMVAEGFSTSQMVTDSSSSLPSSALSDAPLATGDDDSDDDGRGTPRGTVRDMMGSLPFSLALLRPSSPTRAFVLPSAAGPALHVVSSCRGAVVSCCRDAAATATS